MRRSRRRWLTGVVLLSLVVTAGLYYMRSRPPRQGRLPAPVGALPPMQAGPRPAPVEPATAQAPAPAPVDPLAAVAGNARALPAEKAQAILREALQSAAAGHLLQARTGLADALNSRSLTAAEARAARQTLLEVSQKTLFTRQVVDGDPCTLSYVVKPGDTLVGIERANKLRVPAQLIMKINGIAEARQIAAGQRLKLIRGPFHAVVAKGRHTMDVYLEEPGTGRLILAREFAVGIGKEGSTPVGQWRLALGGKMQHAPWTPPSSSDLARRRILWGERDYPLGAKGYWISLQGVGENALSAEDGYGIHGTNDPSSIGQDISMGCIRLADEDIETVFALLYEHWSRVTVLP